MIVIRQANQNHLDILGINRKTTDKFRFLKYLIIVDVDNGKAIFNMLTRAFIWLPNEQWNGLFTEQYMDVCDWMWNNYFLVPTDYDENIMQNHIKTILRPKYTDPTYLKQGTIEEFTIFTTMACNARCFYCYEKGRPQTPMKSDTARKVGDWIVKYAIKNGNPIKLRWFGGEPLVNENAIDIICQIVQDAGFNYVSNITSNGFLFKEEKFNKYHDLWHFNSCQITIDGTEEVYNKTKNYKNVKGKSPYQIVCNNAKMLADKGVNVQIRMNLDQYNADNIKELIPELFNKWGHHPNIALYNYPIFEDPDNPRTDEEKKALYEKLLEADKVLERFGYYHPREQGPFLRYTHCMIDSGSAVVIGTQGDLGLCEHFSEDHFWGHIDKPDMKDMKEIGSFQTYSDFEDTLCYNCPIKPNCIKAKMCEDLKDCNIYQKEYEIKQVNDSVREMYFNWKTNEEQLKKQQEQQNIQQNQQVSNNQYQLNDKKEEPVIDFTKQNKFKNLLKKIF